MNDNSLLKEEKEFIEKYGKDWENKVNWYYISYYQSLSEAFIERNCARVNWRGISCYQRLSEAFIERYCDRVDWYEISRYQSLSEAFIERNCARVDWRGISCYQRLSEAFIERYCDRVGVDWCGISRYQRLSEAFIERNCDRLNWCNISRYQRLSEAFIERHADKIDKEVQMLSHHRRYDPAAEAQQYAERHGLKVQDGYLYAYRNHDSWGRGAYSNAIYYDQCEPHEYRDWHCNLDPNEENSFGLGIWPTGNTAVKVALEDFGCEVKRDDGKARVWAFQIVKKGK